MKKQKTIAPTPAEKVANRVALARVHLDTAKEVAELALRAEAFGPGPDARLLVAVTRAAKALDAALTDLQAMVPRERSAAYWFARIRETERRGGLED